MTGNPQLSENVKVVIRRLPKHMTESELLEQISPLPAEVTDYYFFPANFAFDQHSFASMYLTFSSFCDALIDFEQRFNGYIFVDSKGNDSAASVEAALNQSFAVCNREKMKTDSRNGQVESDPLYAEFLEKIKIDDSTPVLTLEQQIRRVNRPADARTQLNKLETPLVKYFIEKETEKFKCNRRNRRDDIYRRQSDNGLTVMDLLNKAVEKQQHGRRGEVKDRAGPSDSAASRPPRASDIAKEIRKKERDALRRAKFIEKKQNRKEEVDAEKKERKRPGRAPKPVPAKTLNEQQGADWINKLTDPKSNLRKRHENIST